MNAPAASKTLPGPLVLAAVFAIAAAFALVGYAKATGTGGTPRPSAAVAQERLLRFADRADGGVAIIDADADVEVGLLEPGSAPFIRGILRSFARERRMNEIGAEPPFRLARRADGTVFMSDPSTGRSIELDAFGSTNEADFARLLTMRKAPS